MTCDVLVYFIKKTGMSSIGKPERLWCGYSWFYDLVVDKSNDDSSINMGGIMVKYKG